MPPVIHNLSSPTKTLAASFLWVDIFRSVPVKVEFKLMHSSFTKYNYSNSDAPPQMIAIFLKNPPVAPVTPGVGLSG